MDERAPRIMNIEGKGELLEENIQAKLKKKGQCVEI